MSLHHQHTPHSHSHSEINHGLAITKNNTLDRIFILSIVINTIYVVFEAVAGFVTDSMGLLSDAGHNLSDVASLLLALFAFKASNKSPTSQYTYGFGRATIEASLINAIVLYVAVILIIIESIEKISNPTPINGSAVAWVSTIGVIINGVTAWLLMKNSGQDLNVKGAYLHMVADTLVSVGVVVAGIIISFTGYYLIDPIIGMLIALLIAITSYSQLRDSIRLVLDGVPSSISTDKITQAILSVPGVKSMHHLHIWAMSTSVNAMTVHVVVDNLFDIDRIIQEIRKNVASLGVDHSTIEAETIENCRNFDSKNNIKCYDA